MFRKCTKVSLQKMFGCKWGNKCSKNAKFSQKTLGNIFKRFFLKIMDMFAKFFDIFGTFITPFIAQFIAQFITPFITKTFLQTYWVFPNFLGFSEHYCTIYCTNIFCELFGFFPKEKT